MWRTTLILAILAFPVTAQEGAVTSDEYLRLARTAMEAQMKVGDILREKGDHDGAIAAYKKAIRLFEQAVARADGAKTLTAKAVPAAKAPKVKAVGLRAIGPVVADAGKVAKQKPPAAADRQRKADRFVAILNDQASGVQQRYNAAVQLGDLELPVAVKPLITSLENDPNELVRRASAWSLGKIGKQAAEAVPALIQQIGGEKTYVGYMSERALGEITKAVLGGPVSMGFDPTMAAAQRLEIQKKWEAWWRENKARFTARGSR